MLQAVFDKETAGIIVRGEFFDLDKIYFMNERLAGNYGVDNTCLLDGYGEAAAVLKSLNYEIRHAEHGDRDLYVAYNGIHEDWFAPVGTPAVRILKEEDQNDPDEIINEIEDGVMTDLDIDLDEFYEMDEDMLGVIMNENNYTTEVNDNFVDGCETVAEYAVEAGVTSKAFTEKDYADWSVLKSVLPDKVTEE